MTSSVTRSWSLRRRRTPASRSDGCIASGGGCAPGWGRLRSPAPPHLVPGAGLDPYLLRTRRAFLPMTDIVISRRDNPSWEHEAGVAIINVGNLSELHELLTLA